MKFPKVLLALFPLIAIGCGGGGASGGGGGGGNVPAQNVPFFATDGANPNWDHVWVTIYSINLLPGAGAPVNVFSSTTGLTLDVRSLHDSSGGLFAFLDNAGVPAGTYTGANVLLSKTVSVVNHGQSKTQNIQFSDSSNAAVSGESTFTFQFKNPYMPSASSPVILDFLLSNWSLDGHGKIRAIVSQGSNNGLGDEKRHHPEDVEGMVTNLSGTAPNETFMLNYGDHEDHQVQVTTSSTTEVYNDDGSPNPTLINGEFVGATGVWVDGAFYADQIRIHNTTKGHGEPHPVGAEGTASNLNEAAGTFDLTLDHAEDFVPNSMVTPVVINSHTKCFYTNGVHVGIKDFFDEIKLAPPGSVVDLVANYDGTTLTGIFAIILPEGLGGGPFYQVLLAGSAKKINQSAGTMDLNVQQWENFEGGDGLKASVTTSSSTIYRINLNIVSAADFYAALDKNDLVAVYGVYNNGTVTASDLAVITVSFGS